MEQSNVTPLHQAERFADTLDLVYAFDLVLRRAGFGLSSMRASMVAGRSKLAACWHGNGLNCPRPTVVLVSRPDHKLLTLASAGDVQVFDGRDWPAALEELAELLAR